MFSVPKFNLAAVSALCGGKYKSRMLFAAGDKPHLSLRLRKGEDPLKSAQQVVEDYAAAAAE